MLATFLVLFGLFTAYSQFSLTHDFKRLEAQAMADNQNRLLNTLHGEIDVIHGKILDYSQWDAAYNFTLKPNQDFIDENYGGQILEGLGVNVVAHFGVQGQLIYYIDQDSTGLDPNEGTDSALVKILQEGWVKTWLESPEFKDSVAWDYRVIEYKNRPLLVSRHSLQNSATDAPPKGMLFFCRYLDAEILNHITEKTRIKVNVIMGSELENLGSKLSLKPDTVHLKEVSDSIISGTLLLADPEGKPVIAYKAEFPRRVMSIGRGTIETVMVAISLMGVVLMITVLFLSHRVILRRLLKLRKDLADSGPEQKPVAVDGRKDEITYLQTTVNSLFDDLRARNLLIEQRNRDMGTMLGNLEQGVIMIQLDGSIHPEFALKTPEILHVSADDLAGRDAFELLFVKTDWTEDIRSQVRESLNCCLGADELQYELNCDGLPSEVHWVNETGEFFFELSWAPIWNADQEAEKLLLAIRDVTRLRELEQDMRRQREQLLLLEKLLEVSPADLDRFVSQANQRLALVDQRLEAGLVGDQDLNEVFRELHTLKGNSRILGFMEVAAVVHEAEDPVQEMRRTGVDPELIQLCRGRLKHVLEGVQQLRETYLRRFRNLIGSKDRKLFIPKEYLDTLLQEFTDRDRNHVQHSKEWMESFREVVETMATKPEDLVEIPEPQSFDQSKDDDVWQYLKQLAQSSFESLGTIVNRQLQGLNTAAAQLGKPLPHVEYPDQEMMIRKESADQLSEAMGHMLRNSLDHGFEMPDERVLVGKPIEGTIHLQIELKDLENDQIPQLIYWDDGKGVDPNVLIRKLQDRGILVDGRTDHWLVEQLFMPGFSTKEVVSDLSGRGVGMDAVRALVEKMGGAIDVEALPRTENGRIPLKFRLEFPRMSTLIFDGVNV